MFVLQMDKASIIKDAIEYIQQLHEQEKIIQAEIVELESGMPKNNNNNNPIIGYEFEQELPVLLRSKKKRTTDQQLCDSVTSIRNSPIEVLEVGLVNPLSLSFNMCHSLCSLSLSCIIVML